jgi:hypothetical protein
MSRAEVQRKVRVTAAVITQRPAQRAVAGADSGVQMGSVVGAQPHRIRLVPIAPLRLAPGQFTQESLSMWWRGGGKIPPLSRITGHLRHANETTFARDHPAQGW